MLFHKDGNSRKWECKANKKVSAASIAGMCYCQRYIEKLDFIRKAGDLKQIDK